MTRFRDDRRGISVAVTHILAIGITTILIAGLLISAGSVLDRERENAARDELNTIGDRIGTEMSSLDRAGTPGADERIELETNHPSRVSGSSYTVRLRDGSVCDVNYVDEYDGCLVMSTSELDRDVIVPLDLRDGTNVETGAASGGDVFIVYENDPDDPDDPTITIENEP